jgi:predicted enzyme involved in methoxymalonyl-ACP biosynthesis
MATLYDLRQDYQILLEQLYDGEVSEEILLDTLDSIESAIEDKADSYAKILRQFDADIDNIKYEIKRLEMRKKVLESRKDFLKGNLFTAMKAVGLTKIKTPLFTVNIQKNGGKAPLVITAKTTDELPTEFVIAKVEPNKEYIREYLEAGNELPFAYIGEQGESLRIR